jgi:hypothetical protein
MGIFERIVEELIESESLLKTRFGFEARSLTPFEHQEAKKIFGNWLDYKAIRIFEGAKLPNFLDDIGRLLKQMPKREINVKNAITLGNNCFFGRKLNTDDIKDLDQKLNRPQIAEMSWLIHELTHAWQYQTLGWKYLWEAWDAQTKLGAKVYDYGGEKNLIKRQKRGGKIKDFNLEQQGMIIQQYWERLAKGEDTSAYEAYIRQIS